MFAGEPAGVAGLTSARPLCLVDERLCAEDDGECEPFGVLGVGLGGVDHDPQVVAGDDEGVAVECDEPDTDLNGRTGTQTVEAGGAIIVRMAQIGPDGPAGTVGSADGPIAW
jgi:hypothetical protein